jgi:F-type H+-transporting ATPase subunit b
MQIVSPGLGLIFWMTLSFLILFFILKKFAWKPIVNALNEREKAIDNALHSADKARQEMAALQFSNEQLLRDAKDERDALMRDAHKVKDSIIEEARQKASQEGQRMIENARESIQNEKMAAITELKNQVADLSIEIAEKLLQQELSEPNKQKSTIEKWLKDVKIN